MFDRTFFRGKKTYGLVKGAILKEIECQKISNKG